MHIAASSVVKLLLDRGERLLAALQNPIEFWLSDGNVLKAHCWKADREVI
jgi:hypothetical protein